MIHVSRSKASLGSRHQPEQTRNAILDAAASQFAAKGIAGARTEAIARAAGVNKALLYYYFKDKRALYGAVLDRVVTGLERAVQKQLNRDLPTREKILAFASAHFDYFASARYSELLIRELMYAGRSSLAHLPATVKRYVKLVSHRLSEVLREGIATGDFRPVDPMQFLPLIMALSTFYFGIAPVIRLIAGEDPQVPERMQTSRAVVVDLVCATLFRPWESEAVKRRSRTLKRISKSAGILTFAPWLLA